MTATARRKWLALALLSAVQFMVVLDIAIVNVALPSIQVDLGFSQENLQWVISAYALVFGGFLLLGGRVGRPARAAADLPRRPRRLHPRLAPRRPRLVGGVADRGARVPGARRGDHHAGRALDPLDDVRRGARAQHRARRLGRRRRLRRRRGRAARRDPHRRAELGVDLLRQRPGRRRSRSSLAPFLLDESRDASVKTLRPARARCSSPPGSRRSSTRSRRPARTAGSPARRSAFFAGVAGPARRLRRLGAPAPRAADALRASSAPRRSRARTWPASSWARRCSRCS